jgi:hypothetical protein
VERCQGEKLARAIERFEWRDGIIPIRRVQRILWVELIGWIERIIGVVPIRRVDRITGIETVCRVEGIVGRVGLRRVQRVVRCIPTGRVEDIVVALVFRIEALFGECGSSETDEQDHECNRKSASHKSFAGGLILGGYEPRRKC